MDFSAETIGGEEYAIPFYPNMLVRPIPPLPPAPHAFHTATPSFNSAPVNFADTLPGLQDNLPQSGLASGYTAPASYEEGDGHHPPPPIRDPADWECPNAKCRNINFKKRSKCNLCGTCKDGDKKEIPLTIQGPPGLFKAGDWACPSCGNVNWDWRDRCNICNNLKPELQDKREGGLGGGYYDRQDPQDKKQWDSDDEEFDDFGRKKKKIIVSQETERKEKKKVLTPAEEEKKRKQQAALDRLYNKAKGRTAKQCPEEETVIKEKEKEDPVEKKEERRSRARSPRVHSPRARSPRVHSPRRRERSRSRRRDRDRR